MDGLTIGYLAERNARKRPDKTAVIERRENKRRDVTYAEFNERIDRLANALDAAGVGYDEKVAVYMRNNLETLESYLAIAKLGALFVPINHRFQNQEVQYVLSNSDSKALIFDDTVRAAVDSVADTSDIPTETFVHVGDGTPRYAQPYESFTAHPDPVEVRPTRIDRAALMYTSGTTGRPKGCILTHDNLIQATVNGMLEGGPIVERRQGRTLVLTPLFHIAAFGLFLGNVYSGSTIVLADGFDPNRTLEIIEDEQVTSAFLVPTIGRQLLSEETVDDYDISSLESLSLGAAPSGEQLKNAIGESFDTSLAEAFGQTEMSPTTCILSAAAAEEKPDSVGRPLVNVEVKVVDDDGNELPTGAVGRVAYTGPTRFQGYYKMPEKTKEVITDDGWFVSDDLVRMDEDGFLYFVGRADDMLISGGENIHPAEIEEVLHEHPNIGEAAVIGVPDETWGERVKAVVVPAEGADLTESDVVGHVEDHLADYKKPREVAFRDALPRNPTGKVLKHKLS